MTATTPEIESLAQWSEPVSGKRVATPTGAFWQAWRNHQQFLKRSGVRCFKSGEEWSCEWVQVGPFRNVPAIPPPFKKETTWSAEQIAIFDWFEHGSQNLVVGAYAGTGKTTTMKEGFSHAPEERMLYAVFNKKNQREASAKITDPRVEIKTLHAVGFACVARVWSGVAPDDSVEADRIKDIVGEDTKEEIRSAIFKLVTFAKNSLIEPSIDELIQIAEDRMIDAVEFESEEKGGWKLEKLAQAALGVLELSKSRDPENRISFADMVWLPVALNWVRPWYDLVVVDEAQDMSRPQLEMSKRLSRSRICVVGDDRQCIYGFRGAVHGALEIMRDELNALSLGLTTTYRCPKEVVQLARAFVPDYQAAPSAPRGTVDNAPQDKLADICKIGDAVLSRNNAQLMPLCLSLLRRNIPARIEGRDIGKQLTGLVKQMKAKSVPNFLEKIQKWGSKIKARILKRKNSEDRVAQVNDQVETLLCIAEGLKSVTEIESRISELFQDSGDAKPAVVFSTVHKAKGLEWNRVFNRQMVCDKVNDCNARFRPFENRSLFYSIANSHEPGAVCYRMSKDELKEFLTSGKTARRETVSGGRNNESESMKTSKGKTETASVKSAVCELSYTGKYTKQAAARLIAKQFKISERQAAKAVSDCRYYQKHDGVQLGRWLEAEKATKPAKQSASKPATAHKTSKPVKSAEAAKPVAKSEKSAASKVPPVPAAPSPILPPPPASVEETQPLTA